MNFNKQKNRCDLHTTRCCSFRMLFTFYIQPNIIRTRKCMSKKQNKKQKKTFREKKGESTFFDMGQPFGYLFKNELIHFSSDSQVIYCQRNSIFNFYFAFNFSLDDKYRSTGKSPVLVIIMEIVRRRCKLLLS